MLYCTILYYIIQYIYSLMLSHFHLFFINCRAVKIESSSCSQSMILAIVKALSSSLQSTYITLSRKEVEKMRRAAILKNIPQELLSTANLISALFDEIEEEKNPIIVTFTDDISWLINSQATGEIVLEEMRSSSSKIFFVFVQPDLEIKVGQTASFLRDERTKKVVPEPTPSPGGFPNFASFFQNQSPMAGFSNQNQGPVPQQQQQQQLGNNQEERDPRPQQNFFTPNPSFLPPTMGQGQGQGQNFPLGMNGFMPPGAVFGRSFQVSIQNGTGNKLFHYYQY